LPGPLLRRSIIARTTLALVTSGIRPHGITAYHSYEGADSQFVG
jgi:hypothetical protein